MLDVLQLVRKIIGVQKGYVILCLILFLISPFLLSKHYLKGFYITQLFVLILIVLLYNSDDDQSIKRFYKLYNVGLYKVHTAKVILLSGIVLFQIFTSELGFYVATLTFSFQSFIGFIVDYIVLVTLTILVGYPKSIFYKVIMLAGLVFFFSFLIKYIPMVIKIPGILGLMTLIYYQIKHEGSYQI